MLVQQGDKVTPDQVVAQALLPGVLQTIKLAEKLGVEPKDVSASVSLKPGDKVEKGQVICETKGLFGFFKTTITSDHTGTVESVSEVTGNALVREAPIPVDVKAYIQGQIAEIMPEEGVVVETRCAMVQGIFGVGGERHGVIRVAVNNPSETLDESHIQASDAGKILISGSGVTYAALIRASEAGVLGIVAGGVKDSDLIKFLGFDIGVAITGQEQISLSLMVTEGFGFLNMAERTFGLLKSLEGRTASINGATQIRAGVIRPEIIVPLAADAAAHEQSMEAFELKAGSSIRIIREPYFGKLGTVTDLPAQLVTLESGTEVRVLRARIDTGEEVTVPRANVEITAS